MFASFVLLSTLTSQTEPVKLTLPTRVLSLSTDPAHLRVRGNRLYLSGFHSHKLMTLSTTGKQAAVELPLNTSGGDLVLAKGKLFVGQVFTDSVLVVDQATFEPVKQLPLGGEGCMAATRDGKTVFFASNKKSEFHIIDTATFKCRTIAYPPGGRGIGCLAVSPDQQRLYLGIQRGGKMPDGKSLSGGNCFLAVYDLAKQQYAGTVFLAQQRPNGEGDDAIPKSLAFAPDGKRLYIGTFQSEAGVLVVDTQKLKLIDNIAFASKHQKPAFPWVDPMSVAIFDRWLLVGVRHNQEIAVVERATHKVVARITHSAAVDLQSVVVEKGKVYLFGGSSSVSLVQGTDLSRLLRSINLKKTGPVSVTLKQR